MSALISQWMFNPFPDDKFVDCSNMKDVADDKSKEQSVTNSLGTISTSSIVTTSPLVVPACTAGFNNVTRLSTSASTTGTLVRPPPYNTTLFRNNPQQTQFYGTQQSQSRTLPETSQRVLNQLYVGQNSTGNLATQSLTTQPTDLIKRLLIRNLQASQLLQIKLKQEQEKPDSSPEHLETIQNLQNQKLKTNQSFLQLTQKFKEIRGCRPVAVASPGAGSLSHPPPEQPIRDSRPVPVPSSNVGHVPHPLPDKPTINRGGCSGTESSPMTVINLQANLRPEESEKKMESRFFQQDDLSPHLSTCDFPMSTDFVEASIYASSPNSLFMYDQEKMDMQSTMPNIVGTSTLIDTNAFQDNFELEPKYETSQDLSSSVTVTSSATTDSLISSAMIYDTGGGGMWVNTKQNDEVLLKKNNSNGTGTNPTLAELNLDLLDDIQNMIDVDLNTVSHPSVQYECVPTIKQETHNPCDKDKVYETLTRVQVPGQMSAESYRGQVKVKQEPTDFTSCLGLHSGWNQYMTKTEPIKSEKITQTKTVKELSHTAKQGSIDISDTSTLQQLLHGRPLDALVRTPRTRSISESIDVRPHTSVAGQSRKRGSTSAGLESMDRKWEEIKKFIHMETQDDLGVLPPVNVKRERKRYDSASSTITLTSNEDDDSDSDRDIDDDSDSDFEGGTDLGMLNPDESLVGNSKEKQYFWQYNVQSKGPKGTRVHFEMEEDPHVSHDFQDPVFDPVNSNRAGVGITIKHGGKARKGDGNDIVPNPKRLCQIGLQLRKINKQINDFVPVSELPSAARNKTRKEKNKLASRACRLKKKAQHEANKIKLNGLESEHYQLLSVIKKVQKILSERLHKKEHHNISMAEKLEELINEHLHTMIAGNTTDFVNRVVRAVEGGDITGGISFHTRRSYPKELHN